MKRSGLFLLAAMATVSSLALTDVKAGPLRDRLTQGGDDGGLSGLGKLDTQKSQMASQATTVSYGADARQAMDIYPQTPGKSAPIVIMVHGGAWRTGDKTSAGVVDNKLTYWGMGKGYVFISVNNRLLPQADPLTQAEDVARAIAFVQLHAAQYGGDGKRIILIGHSAGAHLVALLSAEPRLAAVNGARPWLGTVVLDSAALDVASIMNQRHLPFYDKAFGGDKGYWDSVSPTAVLSHNAVPMMLVCSTLRKDNPCDQAHLFQARLKAIGQEAPVSEQALTHADINRNLGLPGDYTDAVDAFVEARLR